MWTKQFGFSISVSDANFTSGVKFASDTKILRPNCFVQSDFRTNQRVVIWKDKFDDQLAKRTKDRSSRYELLDLLQSLKSNLSNLKANGQCVNNFLTQGRPSVDEIEDLSFPFKEWMEEIEPLVSAQFNAQNFATLSEENLKQEQNKCLELQEGVQAQRISIGKLQKNMLMIEALYKTIQNSQIQNSTQDNESVASLSDRVIGIMNRYNAISSNVEERAQQLYFDIEESLQVLRL